MDIERTGTVSYLCFVFLERCLGATRTKQYNLAYLSVQRLNHLLHFGNVPTGIESIRVEYRTPLRAVILQFFVGKGIIGVTRLRALERLRKESKNFAIFEEVSRQPNRAHWGKVDDLLFNQLQSTANHFFIRVIDQSITNMSPVFRNGMQPAR